MTTEKAPPVTLEVQVTGVSEKAKKDGTGSYRLLDVLLGGKPNKVFAWSPDAVLGVVAGKTYRLTVEKKSNASGAGFFYTLVGSPKEVAAASSSGPGVVETAQAVSTTNRNGATDRSIERQVAVKAATEVYLGLLEKRSPDSFKDEANAEKIANWIVRVAAVLSAFMAHGDDVIQRAAAPQITSTPPGAAP